MVADTAPRGNEKTGVAIAVALHVVVIGLLSVQWTGGDRRFDNPPMEVDLVAETAAESSAPIISEAPPAPRLGEETSEEIAVAEPEPTPPKPLPEPVARPKPTPTHSNARVKPTPTANSRDKKKPQVTAPAPSGTRGKPSDTKPKPNARGQKGRLDGIIDGLTPESTQSQSSGAPASRTAAQVQRSAQAAVDRQIKPFWERNARALSGVDVELLRLTLEIRLRADGTVVDIRQVGELGGKTDSNAPQQKRFVEQAIKSVKQVARFEIEANGYDGIIVVKQPFKANRSQ